MTTKNPVALRKWLTSAKLLIPLILILILLIFFVPVLGIVKAAAILAHAAGFINQPGILYFIAGVLTGSDAFIHGSLVAQVVAGQGQLWLARLALPLFDKLINFVSWFVNLLSGWLPDIDWLRRLALGVEGRKDKAQAWIQSKPVSYFRRVTVKIVLIGSAFSIGTLLWGMIYGDEDWLISMMIITIILMGDTAEIPVLLDELLDKEDRKRMGMQVMRWLTYGFIVFLALTFLVGCFLGVLSRLGAASEWALGSDRYARFSLESRDVDPYRRWIRDRFDKDDHKGRPKKKQGLSESRIEKLQEDLDQAGDDPDERLRVLEQHLEEIKSH